jgi:3-phosphoshikimate 1-carboxyvinyltransferase
LDCLECGSTLRFLLPVAAALCDSFDMVGHGRLAQRPVGELAGALGAHGCSFSGEALPFRVTGRLQSGEYRLPGNISSQYISGLLFALPLLDGDSCITLTSSLSSAAYVQMPIDALARFGICIEKTERGWRIPGGQTYRSPGRVTVEGDWSNAAVWLCAGALAGPVTVTGLNLESLQADVAIVDILGQMGANVFFGRESITVSKGQLQAVSVDVDQFPDLMPVLAMTAAMCSGASLLMGAGRLRLKESDRLAAMSRALSALGIQSIEGRDFLSLRGGALRTGTVDSAGDHRIVMAAALAGTQIPIAIAGAEAIEKSYPTFFRDFAALGGQIIR